MRILIVTSVVLVLVLLVGCGAGTPSVASLKNAYFDNLLSESSKIKVEHRTEDTLIIFFGKSYKIVIESATVEVSDRVEYSHEGLVKVKWLEGGDVQIAQRRTPYALVSYNNSDGVKLYYGSKSKLWKMR